GCDVAIAGSHLEQLTERDLADTFVARAVNVLREEIGESLVEALQLPLGERDADERRRDALRDREDVEPRRTRGAAIVALEDEPPVAFHDDAEDAGLGAKLRVQRRGVEARAGRCRRSEQHRKADRCSRSYSERTSSAHSDIGTYVQSSSLAASDSRVA